MKALHYIGPRHLEFVDMVKPSLRDDEVLLKIAKVGLCGTDFHIYRGDIDVPTPIVLGHEFCGEVVEKGKDVVSFGLGDRVTAEHVITPHNSLYPKNISPDSIVYGKHRQGALAEYMAIPEKLVHKIPSELSYDDAVIVEPLAVALHAVNRASIRQHDRVLVIGQGPIGLFIDAMLQAKGAQVTSFDLNKSRLQFALTHGLAQEVLPVTSDQSIKELLQFKSSPYVDVVFDCVAVDSTVSMGLEVVRPGGKLVVVGVPVKEILLGFKKVVFQEVDIIGSSRCDNEFPDVIEMLSKKILPVNGFITHRYSFDESIKAFEESETYSEGRIKSVIEFSN
jgi:2-desacetyl-2-hydroxyethyl bacteriochlorophyllide A dehydrogenase